MVRIVHIPGDMIRRIRQRITPKSIVVVVSFQSHKLQRRSAASSTQDLLIGDGERAPTRQDDAIHHRRYCIQVTTHTIV